MTDYHVHIGQWGETYHEAEAVFSELKARGTDEAWFSSTTSCRYCKESIAVRDNESLQNELPTARELYELIRYEVQEAFESARKVGIKAHALYWVVPEIHFSASVSIEQAMSELHYEGFKIHPRGNVWNLDDERTAFLAEELFSYADAHGHLVLIHCDEDYPPTLFEPLIASHPRAIVQLAHCRPLGDTLALLRKYSNTVCDTAFVSDDTRREIERTGFANRIRHGTDFPITHYFSEKPERTPTEAELTTFLRTKNPVA